jgi:hypothetical protein
VDADVMHLDDPLVPQAGDRFGLDAEAGHLLLAGPVGVQEHLEGHLALELDVPGLEDDPHAPRPSSWRIS